MPRPLPSEHDCDVLVIGAGPAGLSAALVLARACRRVLVLDSGKPRNNVSRRTGGFLTRDGAHPVEIRRIGREQLAPYADVAFKADTEVVTAETFERGFRLTTAAGESLSGRKMLIAMGVEDRLPPLYDIEEYYGQSVWHCPYCDG